jgi:hypothetical protein
MSSEMATASKVPFDPLPYWPELVGRFGLIVNALLASGPSAGFGLRDEPENSVNRKLPNRAFDPGQLMSHLGQLTT